MHLSVHIFLLADHLSVHIFLLADVTKVRHAQSFIVLRLDFRRSLVSALPSPRRTCLRGRSAGSFPEQRLVIEPTLFFVLPLAWQYKISLFDEWNCFTDEDKLALEKMYCDVNVGTLMNFKPAQPLNLSRLQRQVVPMPLITKIW